MPIYEYACPICNYVEDFIEKVGEFGYHLCPICAEECKTGVRIDLNTNIWSTFCSDFNPYTSSVDQGKRVAMVKVLSAPAVHQAGYQQGDARYGRGNK